MGKYGSYWNPLKKSVLYFHVIEKNVDHYLKVDVDNEKVYKLQVNSLNREGRNNYLRKGLYELKWVTFTSGVVWHLKPENIAFKKGCEAHDGTPRTKVKHTTKGQWEKALNQLLVSIN